MSFPNSDVLSWIRSGFRYSYSYDVASWMLLFSLEGRRASGLCILDCVQTNGFISDMFGGNNRGCFSWIVSKNQRLHIWSNFVSLISKPRDPITLSEDDYCVQSPPKHKVFRFDGKWIELKIIIEFFQWWCQRWILATHINFSPFFDSIFSQLQLWHCGVGL